MENVVLCHPDKEETELDDIPGNRTAPTTEKRIQTGNELLLAVMIT